MDNVLLQYGAIGVIALMALVAVRELFKREIESHQRDTERANRLEAELRELNEAVRTQYMTTLAQATVAMSEAFDVIRGLDNDKRRRNQ